MEEKNYSKREQDSFRKEVLETLQRIETQTMKTNGRVTHLEIDSKVWRARVFGGLSVLSFVMSAVLIPLAIGWLQSH